MAPTRCTLKKALCGVEATRTTTVQWEEMGRGVRHLNPARLHRALIAGSVIGILLPFATIVGNLVADDFRLWHKALEESASLAVWVERHPAFDISRTLPFLETLSWHHNGPTAIGFRYRTTDYLGYAFCNVILLGLILFFRERLRSVFGSFLDWYYSAGYRRAKFMTLSMTGMIVLSFQMKLVLGFWFPGIHGWTHADRRSNVEAAIPDFMDEAARGRAAATPFLDLALEPENARWILNSGYLTKNAMFLHYRGGEVHPANYSLTGTIFPQYPFGKAYELPPNPELFAEVLRASLERRRENRKFLIPFPWAYPDHMTYRHIDYVGSPPPEELERISYWLITIAVDEERNLDIVAAIEKGSIDVL